MTLPANIHKIVNTMNKELITYQTRKLMELIKEIVNCCEDRKMHESQRFGLPYAELKCLMLFIGERYLTVKSISRKLEVAKSRVTKIINGLMEKGMVERIDDPKDSRVRLISLTPQGSKRVEAIEAFQMGIHRDLLFQMNQDERRDVLSSLELIRSSMEAVKEQLV